MSNSLLRQYIRMLVEATPTAHVPTQLLSPDQAKDTDTDTDKDKNDDDEEVVDEFSGVAGAMGGGALGGYTAPLGGDKKKKR